MNDLSCHPVHRVTVTALAVLLPVLSGWTQDKADPLLPDEIAPGVPKTEMMSHWLKAQVTAALDQREEDFEDLTEEDLPTWQEDRRAFFVKQLGGFPERTPLRPVVTGKMEFADHRIEKLYFESQPGLHVTAILYLPKGKGPFPAVLHPTGHSTTAKKRDLYQQASIVIARGGCAVLCYDPIGQGERSQILNADGKPYSTTGQHTLINQAAHLLGSSVARTMIWDGMRAIDYLQSRPDIVADKIGCTGISGGGTNTSYLMSLDDRIVAAAPGCYLTGFRSLFDSIGPQDAEQNIHGQIAFGMDHSDYVLMRLPQPTLIMAATHDYFDIKGAWHLFREAKRFATRQGFPERVDLVEPGTKHGFPAGMRTASANWMRRWLLDRDEPVSGDEPVAIPEEELNATPEGAVLKLKGARSIFQINQERNRDLAAHRKENAKPENREQLKVKIRELIGARAFSDLPDPEVKELREGQFILQPEPGIQLPVTLIERENAVKVTIYLHGEGRLSVLGSGALEKISREDDSHVVAVDLRGLGETKKSGGPGGFNELFGPDWKNTTTASLLGKSYLGMRVEDIWQIVRASRARTSDDSLTPNLIAIGEAAVPALHAAALEPEIFGDVRIFQSIESWSDVVDHPLVKNQQPNLVFGALREYDLPILGAMLGEKVIFEQFLNPDGSEKK